MTDLFSALPVLLLVAGLLLLLWAIHWMLIGRHPHLDNEHKFSRQLLIIAISLLGILAVILVLPIEQSSKNQLIGFVGLFVSGFIAFSSTNILANLMGGVLLRITKPFRVGDFVRVEEHFGRVTQRGLFSTEIQKETRELSSLPNAYLINHPITTTRSSGAIVSTTLSLGYDTHHALIEPLLIKAAETAGLTEPFVHILELGNFAVTYRISGLLEEVQVLVTAHSDLCRCVLDTLHGEGVEIMSPTFMNQRRLKEEFVAIPKNNVVPIPAESRGGEHVVFDKAEEAAQKEREKKSLTETIQKLEASLAQLPEDKKAAIQNQIEAARSRLKEMESEI